MDRQIAQEKAAVRRLITEKIAALSDKQIEEESRQLVSLLQVWVAARGFEVVLATLPLTGEPDLMPFLSWWLASGRRLAFTRTGPHRSMEFREVASLDGPWDSKPSGMREPPAAASLWTPGSRTLALVPGLAFAPAKSGGAHRLGRGAGYYDRWLGMFGPNLFTLGVGFSVQSLDSVPTEHHDHPLNGWVDPSGFHGC